MISEQVVIESFCDKLAEYGIRLADISRLKLDGNWHRARVDGDRGGSLNLSYKIYFDDRPAGFFQDHKRGFSGTFSVASREELSPAERDRQRADWRAVQQRREDEQRQDYLKAAARAQVALQSATGDAASHPYIARKGIVPGPNSALRVDADGNLIIPVYSGFGKIASIQTISADGEKLFMPGGQMAGSFHPINGTNRDRVLVTEGYATGAALNALTGHSVACAMSSGNLEAIARKMKDAFPEREVVICADNDHGTAARLGKNPGLEAAQRAAAVLGCRVVAPRFIEGDTGTDWDDWLRAGGDAEALRREIAGELDYEPVPDESPFDLAAQPVMVLPAAHAELMPRTFKVDISTAPEADDFVPLPYGESNVATKFSATIDRNLRYVDEWGKWMVWDGSRWVADRLRHAAEASKRYCAAIADAAMKDGMTFTTDTQKRTVASRFTEKRVIMNIAELAKSDPRIAASSDQWDADIWLLNTPGGVVDLRTGSLRPGLRSDYMTKLTRVAPGGACPTWHKFLHTATGGDSELILFLQRMCGYSLTGSVRDHALFFVYGTGGNGKGTFLNTFQWLIGDYAKVAGMDVFTEKKNESHTTELARLMGARLVTAQETEEGKRWAEARIKALTGGDPITARFMRQDDFEFLPQFKLVIAGNHKPGLRNVDEAIKRRLHLIPFTATIAPADRDPHLTEKLQAEASGILQWAIEGCVAWQRDGLQAPAMVIAATDEYLEQQDSLGLWIDECCDLGANYECRRSALYQSFKGWAEAAGEYVLPQRRFVAAIEARGITSRIKDGSPLAIGLRVKASQEKVRRSWNDDFG